MEQLVWSFSQIGSHCMSKYLLSFDQGTTSSRAILFGLSGEVIAQSQEEFEQHFPNPGWVEHAPSDLWQTSLTNKHPTVIFNNHKSAIVL